MAVYSTPTRDAVRLLGLEVARARRARRWTMLDLGARAGVSAATVRSVERGGVGVSIGTAFELATLLGIDLFAPVEEMPRLLDRARDRLALLPARARAPIGPVGDDF